MNALSGRGPGQPKKLAPKIPTTFRISPDVDKIIRDQAELMGVSMTLIVEMAIRGMFK